MAQCFQNLIHSDNFGGRNPPVNELHTVYDAADHCTVLVTGGGVYNPAPEFWVYNGLQWTGPYVGTGDLPHARDHFGLCYDSVQGQILLFGGTVTIANGSDFYSVVTNDLYALRGANNGDGATWVKLSAGGASGPPVTRDQAYFEKGEPAAFDPLRNRAIFALPKGDDGYIYQTWEWTGTGWDQGPDFGPAYPVESQQFIFDPYRNEGLLTELDPDTVWRYKPGATAAQGTWTLLTSRPAQVYGPFYGRALVYDPFRHWVLQCFGRDRFVATGSFMLSETRVWNPALFTWVQWPERNFPTNWGRAYPLAVWDTDRDTMVVTIGYDDTSLAGSTYLYDTIEQTDASAGVVSSSSGLFAKCVGDSVTFSVAASGDSPQFQWYKNGAPLTGKTASVLILPNLTADDAGNYYAVVTNDCGYTPSPVSRLRVDEPITIIRPSIFPDCSQICPTLSYTITPPLPHSTGGAPLNIHLQKNFGSTEFPAWADVRVSTPSAPTNFVFDDVERDFTGDYRFYIDGSACGGIVEGSPRHVEVGFDIVAQPQSLDNVRPCSTVTFSVSAFGGCGLIYYWFQVGATNSQLLSDDGHFLGTHSPTLTIAGVHYDDQASYACLVKDTNQCGNAELSTLATLKLTLPQWVLRTTNGPSPRYANAMAYDSGRGVTVMYSGGYVDPANGYRGFGDLWEWDGARWRQRTTFANSNAWHQDINGSWVQNYTDTPAARLQHAMAYDSQRRQTVMFGGRGGPNGVFGDFVFNDTWEWDGTRWYFRSTNGPPATFNDHMTYDPVRGVTVLYGGAFNSAATVWEWDGTNWTSISPTNGPATYYQENACLDFDTALGAVFAGWTGDGFWARYYWTWDGHDWRPRASGFYFGNYSPSYGAMVYDTYRYRSFHYGGQDTTIGYTGSSTSAYYDSASDAWTLLPDAAQKSAFSASDFINVLALAGKLTGQTDPVSQYLWNQFDAATQQVLTDSSSTADQLKSALVSGLNTIINTKAVYDSNRFAAVALSTETQVFKAVNPQFKDLARFNRLLLEDAYRTEIGRSPSTPPGRYYLGLAFDSARRAAVMMGGYYGGAGLNPLNGSDTWELRYLDTPLINQQPASQYRAPGDTAVFTVDAVAPYGSALSYDWYFGNVALSNGGRISGAHSATLQIANVSASDAGSYQARISAPCGSLETAPAILTTDPKLQIFSSGEGLQLLWSAPGLVLQQADSITGPWTTVEGATSPYDLTVQGPKKFFRLNAGSPP